MQDRFLITRIVFIAVFMSLSACLQVFASVFIYWREALLHDFWRLWTAHWVHVGWVHFVLNMLAFMCLPFIFPRTQVRHFIALLLLLPPCISLCFYYFLTDISAYAGLSGVLHGAYVTVACIHLLYPRERNFAALVLLLVLGKLLWENSFGSMGTAELIGSPVLVEAHLLGVIWGMIFAVVYVIHMYVTDK